MSKHDGWVEDVVITQLRATGFLNVIREADVRDYLAKLDAEYCLLRANLSYNIQQLTLE